MDKEIWINIKSYEGLYLISSTGKVKSIKKGNHKDKKNLYLAHDIGYCDHRRVTLVKATIKKRFLVHRLVYSHFIAPLKKGLVINHLDGDPSNNVVSNLEQVTISENGKHAVKIGLLKVKRGEEVGSSKLTEEDVVNIFKIRSTTKLSYAEIGKSYNVSYSTIGDIIKRRCWAHVDIPSKYLS